MPVLSFLRQRMLPLICTLGFLGVSTAPLAQLVGNQNDDSSLLSGASTGGTATSSGKPLSTPSIRSYDRPGAPTTVVASPAAVATLPPNDFQKFVQSSTGQSLPLFGTDFFKANAFVAQGNVPVAADYRMGPGDELEIRGWGSIDVDVRTVVDRNGFIHIPQIGSINMAGVRSSDAEKTIRTAIGRYYRDFELSVTQGQLRGITVYMVGQARQPGAHQMPGNATLVSALFASGGANEQGSMRSVQVKRGNQVVTTLDLYDFIARGNKAADIRLQDGDTIVLQTAKGFVALTGAVSTPAVFELSDDDTLGSLLALAGGLPVVADPKRVYLERVDTSKQPARSVETFALNSKGLNKKLRNGDVLSVLSVNGAFDNAVTLRGNVDQSVRLPWHAGMKITDLIPNKRFLISRASLNRQNSTLQSGDNENTLAQRIGSLVDEVNFDYAVVERIDTQQVTMSLLPFNLGRALDTPSSPDNLALQPGDIVTVFSVNDVRVPQAKRQVFVRVEGEVANPGIYQMAANEGLIDLLNKAGGLTTDAYLFGAEFYREQVRQTQSKNLIKLIEQMELQFQSRLNASSSVINASSEEALKAGQLLKQAEVAAHNRVIQRLRSLRPSGRVMLGLSSEPEKQLVPDLKLQNHDHLVVPPRPDFVYVLGAVSTESALIWQAGKSARHYMDLSGLTAGADDSETFILRADGSVITPNSLGVFSSVNRTTVLPGDTIVLPEKMVTESAWSVFTRSAKDITQIIYQFSLGAAALKTLRD
jgi:protein involved in polysaccharide export with SLBB domain